VARPRGAAGSPGERLPYDTPQHLLAGSQLGMLPSQNGVSPPGPARGEALTGRRVRCGMAAGGAGTRDNGAIPAEQTAHSRRVYAL
jgi:hypothetical protein